ncbi:hypothetical protein [Magnetospira sp. QH-2]|uniref:hypothetical protein n=1 Tax=Magnetospira sp. (strain QH-2) TaxID=1288970 RepID=UPI0003E8139E|nr:hypothetical protein [Magnetospira sp. QH-2]CCQ72315.1 protein of unknown function [Magnetospira sp. QH-2]
MIDSNKVAPVHRVRSDPTGARPVVSEAIARGLKNNYSPAEALTYGVFSAHAKNSLNKATEAVIGKGKELSKVALNSEQRERVRELMADDLVQSGAAYLTDVRKEVQNRMVHNVLDEIFRSPTRSIDKTQ